MQSKSFVYNLWRGAANRLKALTHDPHKKADLNWFKIKKLKHIAPGKTRSYSYKGKAISYANPADFLHGLKEIFVEEIYHVRLPASPFIIDCGANIGLSIIYLKEKYPQAEILAFEPDENNFKLLQQNVSSFGLQKITLSKSAVWTADTELRFKNDANMGSKIDIRSGAGTTSVKAVRLLNCLNRRVDFLKIDIEGAEYEVVKDIRDQLHMVQSMFLEYHGSFSQNAELIEIFDILNKAGFHFYIKEATSVYDHPFLYSDMQSKREYDVQLNIFCIRS